MFAFVVLKQESMPWIFINTVLTSKLWYDFNTTLECGDDVRASSGKKEALC